MVRGGRPSTWRKASLTGISQLRSRVRGNLSSTVLKTGVGSDPHAEFIRWPNPPDHPLQGSEILRQRGYPEDVITAILSHADYLADRYPRTRPVEKALYACDELAGLITATALLRPNGITDLTASSVKKKMKSKGFARNVKREDIDRGSADFGVDLTEHIQFEIDAMKTIAAELGLRRGSGGEDTN